MINFSDIRQLLQCNLQQLDTQMKNQQQTRGFSDWNIIVQRNVLCDMLKLCDDGENTLKLYSYDNQRSN